MVAGSGGGKLLTQPEIPAVGLSGRLGQNGYMQREGERKIINRWYSKSSIHVSCVSFKNYVLRFFYF